MISDGKILKVVLWILGVPVVASILLLVTFYLINIPDEDLRPDVAAVLADRHDAVPDRDNLFFPLLALARVGFVGDKDRLCNLRTQDDCIDRVARDPTGVSGLLSDNSPLLERYQSLQTYQRFENRLHLTHDSPLLDWEAFLNAKGLYLTSIALDRAQGRVAEAVSRLQTDTIFTRRLLAEREVLLIDKLVLAASFRGDLLLAADILHHGSLTAAQYIALRQIAAPVTLAERSLRGPYAREYEMVATVLREMGNPKKAAQLFSPERGSNKVRELNGRFAQHFFKLNATLNFAWELTLRDAKSSEAPCEDRRTVDSTGTSGTFPSLSYAYNPIGKTMVAISRMTSSSYISRLCQLEALQRNLALQIGPG